MPSEAFPQANGKNPFIVSEKDGVIDEFIPNEFLPLEEQDTTQQLVERMARGYILGTTNHRNNSQIRAKLETQVAKRIGRKGKMIVDKLFELIEGVAVLDRETKNGVMYYKVPPNLQAIIYALDRILGKPTQHTESVEEKRGVIIIENVIKGLASPQGMSKPSTQRPKVVDQLPSGKNS
jgi:hypothetical protein